MEIAHLQDRLDWGMNRVANVLGRTTDAYRPNGPSDPLDRSHRFLRLRAAFSRADGNFGQAIGYGVAVCRGYFDASYTRVGDYLVHDQETWFIAQQQTMMPILCVRTNRIVSIARQATPATASSDGSSGNGTMLTLISNWPASFLGTSTEGRSPAQLPGDTRIPGWTTLLPSVHGRVLQPADIVTDELGTTGIIVAAELSDLGWRLNVRQVTT
jgi:hypothetical protein